jgi:hypothetical protein
MRNEKRGLISEEQDDSLKLSGLNSDELEMIQQSRELPQLNELLDYCSIGLQPLADKFATTKLPFA